MKLSQIDTSTLSKEQITKILFSNEQNEHKQGDCIFVYGGKGIERVHKAVELYNQGRAKYILFTGGYKYGMYAYSEAATMTDSAIKMGVPAKSILTEELSNNTKENAISSLFTL
ncbi:MAG: YdcF family protein [Cyanobacteria bacterium P01_A01_bin.83]